MTLECEVFNMGDHRGAYKGSLGVQSTNRSEVVLRLPFLARF
jgi:hypothetical protein